MKKNTGAIEVKPTKVLLKNLKTIFDSGEANMVIESGTFLGKGTTQMFIDAGVPMIYTIEGKGWAFEQAKENLRSYEYVNVLYGLSLGFEECKQFIQNDTFLANHEAFPDILCDNIENPQAYYLNELATMRGAEPRTLSRLIDQYKDTHKLLFCLDSCGGIGFLEYQAVVSLMGNKGFYLFLDDINHCKHYRSFEDIRVNQDKRWEIIYNTKRVALVRRKDREDVSL